jgi:hypothetical protein
VHRDERGGRAHGGGAVTRALLLALLLSACAVEGSDSAVDGESPSETCSRVAAVICQKLFECYSADERAAAMLPATQEDCLAQIEGDLECATQTVDNQCDQGEAYDPDMAQSCVVEYEGLTCDIVREGIGDDDTPSCAQVCL